MTEQLEKEITSLQQDNERLRKEIARLSRLLSLAGKDPKPKAYGWIPPVPDPSPSPSEKRGCQFDGSWS